MRPEILLKSSFRAHDVFLLIGNIVYREKLLIQLNAFDAKIL